MAEVLADQDKGVEIITGLNKVGSDIPMPVWHHLYERLLGKGVVMSPMTGVTRIGEDFVDVFHVVNPDSDQDHSVGGHGGRGCGRAGQRRAVQFAGGYG